LHKLEDQVFELNKAAAELAKKAALTADRPILVVGSMGPTGEIMQPMGPLSEHDCEQAFRAQAEGLKAGGADVLCLETISSPDELRAGVKGAKSAGLPVCATMSFDTAGRTMMGLTPEDFVKLAEELELDGLGANCGVGASDLIASLLNMQSTNTKIPVIAKANCGIPQYIDGKIVYSGTCDLMHDYAKIALNAGATIVGGCCGTTAEHVAAMRSAIDAHERGPVPDITAIENALGQMSMGSRAIAAGQMALPESRRSKRSSRH
ncbi:MAG: homocysteine S-methyltransferase family protein, partial [Alphaproteobacteria bacterium]